MRRTADGSLYFASSDMIDFLRVFLPIQLSFGFVLRPTDEPTALSCSIWLCHRYHVVKFRKNDIVRADTGGYSESVVGRESRNRGKVGREMDSARNCVLRQKIPMAY